MITVEVSSRSCSVCSSVGWGMGVVELNIKDPRLGVFSVALCEKHAREAATELTAAVQESMLLRMLGIQVQAVK